MAERLVIQIVTTGGDSTRRESAKAASGLASVEKGAGRTRTALLGSAKSAVKFAATGVGIAGVGIAAVKTVKTVVDMDTAMRNVNSIAGLSEKQLAGMRGELVKLGGKTAQQPVTLAKGLYDLVSSGFDAHESLKILGSSARAATAGLTTTEVSTSAVAAVLNAYRLPAGKAAAVSDTLFQTVKRGVISFEELASNIGDVLPFASTLGVNLRQVGASISTMTKAGISAPETMTRIKAAMQSFIKPSVAMKAALKDIGVESGEALIKQKGFQGALEAMIGTTDGSKEAVAKLFPNIRALGAAFALTGKNTKEARRDVRGMKDDTGATAGALAEQSKSISFAWNQVKAVASGLAIQVGSHLVPAFASALQFLAQLPAHASSAVEALGRVALIQNLVTIVGQFASALSHVASAAADVGGAIASFLGPVASIAGDFMQSGVAIRLFNTALGAGLGFIAAYAARWVVLAGAIQVGRIVAAVSAVKSLGAALQVATAAAAANPWTALAVVLGAAAGALGLFGGSEESAADQTRALNDAIAAQRQALNELAGIQITQQAAQAQVTLAQEQLRVSTVAVSKAVKKYGADSRQAKLAEAQRALASEQLQSAQQRLGDIEATTGDKAVKAQEDAQKALDDTKSALDKANDGVDNARKGMGDLGDALERQKGAQENYNKALKNFNSTMDVVEQSTGFGKRAADALTKSLQKVPPKVRTRIETDDADAKRRLAAVMARLRAADGEKAVQRILGNASSAQAAISAAQARLNAIDGSTATVYIHGVNSIAGIQGKQSGGPVYPASWLRRAAGGKIPGSGRGDRVPLMGEPGEFMMKRTAVQRYGLSAMYAVNRGDADIVGYQDGGAIHKPKRRTSATSASKKHHRKLPSARDLLKAKIPGVSGAAIDALRDTIEQVRRGIDDAARLFDLSDEVFLVENPAYDPDSTEAANRVPELVDAAAVAARVAEIDELLKGGPTAGKPGGYEHLKQLFDPKLVDTMKSIEKRYTTAIKAGEQLVADLEARVKKLNAQIAKWKGKAHDERHRELKGSTRKAKEADRKLRTKTADGYQKKADQITNLRDRLLERKRNTKSRIGEWRSSRNEVTRSRELDLPWDVKDVAYEIKRLNQERGDISGTKAPPPDELDTTSSGGGDGGSISDEYARLLEEQVSGLRKELAVSRAEVPVFQDFLGSFAGGLSKVPRDAFAFVHKGEGIVPADGGPALAPKLELHLHGGLDAIVEKATMVVGGKLTEVAVKAGRSRTFPGRPGRLATYRS